eukprot:CAMPEP_0117896172 /NCGR_PEP_ID=MMETSP0950-20121206/27096_1 /TAXON_ID=44440 /ORGANISM="Chattonella subsalsa, Strain CCMP2191" /LENGTH=666 /DNA_ID=CAMNT_0005757237 /DNA_START=132 /DNA_END=2132 /DNA_ORIENTATION=+
MEQATLSHSKSEQRLPSIRDRSNRSSHFSPTPSSRRSSPLPSRRLRTNVGSTNKPRQKLLSSSLSTPILTKKSLHENEQDERPKTSEGGFPISSPSKSHQNSKRPASMHSELSKLNEKSMDQSQQTQNKSREMAVWTKSLVPTEEIWDTETRTKVGKGRMNSQQRLLDSTMVKAEIALQQRNKHMVDKARMQLDRIAREKYGSIRGLFRMFDSDQDGRISMEEFSAGLKARNLEKVFPREQQRLVFDHIDSSNDNYVSMNEFTDFFSGIKEIGSSVPMSPKTSVRNDIELEKMRDKLKQKLVNQKRALKMEDGYSENTTYLINAFRQIDEDQTGFIYYDEFKKALGPQFLNLGLDDRETMKLFESMDLSNDNPFIDQKQKQVKELKRKANAPWAYPMSTKEMKQKYQEFLGRTGEPEVQPDPPKTPPEMDTVEALQLTSKFDLDRFNRTQEAMANLKLDTKTDIASSQDLFSDMSATQEMKMGSIVKRITAPPPTDWTRVGYGGNGMDRTSGMYTTSDQRFKTTSKEHFADVIYAPNQPVTRETVSDTEKLAKFRKKKFETIRRRQKEHVDRIFAGIEMEETIKKMQTDARIQSKAKSLAKYCEFAYAEDLKNVKKMPLMGMQKKASNENYARMWGGSPDSQFNTPDFFKIKKQERNGIELFTRIL